MNTLAINKNNWVVIFSDNYYRFIDTDNKLLTTGFKAKDKLLAYKDNIRIDDPAVKIMQLRYSHFIKS